MKKPNENDILETALSIAEKGYPEAYQFLLNAYEESTSSSGPQTFYFLGGIARKCWRMTTLRRLKAMQNFFC